MKSSGHHPTYTSYDDASGNYSWDWGGPHLLQLNRYLGDTDKSHPSGMQWIQNDLQTNASDGRPVIIFQHYGFTGNTNATWYTADNVVNFVQTIAPDNVIGVFTGHEHVKETPQHSPAGVVTKQNATVSETAALNMYDDGYDSFIPGAAYEGCSAVIHVTDRAMDVQYASCNSGGSESYNPFTKPLVRPPVTAAQEQIQKFMSGMAFFALNGQDYAITADNSGAWTISPVVNKAISTARASATGRWTSDQWSLTSMAPNGVPTIVAVGQNCGYVTQYQVTSFNGVPTLRSVWSGAVPGQITVLPSSKYHICCHMTRLPVAPRSTPFPVQVKRLRCGRKPGHWQGLGVSCDAPNRAA